MHQYYCPKIALANFFVKYILDECGVILVDKMNGYISLGLGEDTKTRGATSC